MAWLLRRLRAAEVDRVFDSASRHPGAIRAVTSTEEARTTVLLDEIVALMADRGGLVDPRLWALRDYDAEHDGPLLDTLRAYVDCFGDIAAAGDDLHVHPNTVRYRVRRIEQLLGTLARQSGRSPGAWAGLAGYVANRCAAAAIRSSVAVSAIRTC